MVLLTWSLFSRTFSSVSRTTSSEVGSDRNTKNKESEVMKYVIYGALKEPYEENWKKMLEIEKERQKREVTFDQTGEMIGQYMFLEGNKSFQIIETFLPTLSTLL